MAKNILIGKGETLTTPISQKRGGGPKHAPYSYTEARERLVRHLRNFLSESESIDPDAIYEGQIVSKVTLHPTYLAKSYYPSKLVSEFGLRSIGSKPVKIRPEKAAARSKRGKELLTASYFFSAPIGFYENLLNAINEGKDLPKGVKDDIVKVESLESFSASEKIKGRSDQNVASYEIALHTPDYFKNVPEVFGNFLSKHKSSIDKTLTAGDITFVSASLEREELEEVANFSMLRNIRPMPGIRVLDPPVRAEIGQHQDLEIPDSEALNNDVKVAVFDGGISNTLDKWVREFTYAGQTGKIASLLRHGGQVTSSILFGRQSPDIQALGKPLCNVDHYRVLDNGKEDLYDVLERIKNALQEVDYDYVNLSLGPNIPIEDDDVHSWTSTLESVLSNGRTLTTIAVGNDGDINGQNRIQPPADLVNGLSVGSADSYDKNWGRASYSCVGPGRSPGKVKPDAVCFGGVQDNPLPIYCPLTGMVQGVGGTSFSAPLALRVCAGIQSYIKDPLTPLATKAIAIHSAEENSNLSKEEIGWGRISDNLDDVLYTDDHEATIIYQDKIYPSRRVRIPIPCPELSSRGKKLKIKATFCFATTVDPEHPIHYTHNGLSVTFYRDQDKMNTDTFFSLKNIYESEQEAREDAHKWETCLHNERSFMADKVPNPCFEVVHGIRNKGQPVDQGGEENPLPYVLVITVSSGESSDVYQSILRNHQTLQPLELESDVQIQT
ncbi:S8 family peptidase [Halospina sp. K52047b]|uniref:S8 family peptidase n=1 Tax=Halospina sp. K52047b TaxID=2614160 RepID=UPI00124A0E03|nr:S8 family peptidase [Halospina sp. K52047b]KAA8976920.1 S8 family peptidase [Halospina sp. K52047b]